MSRGCGRLLIGCIGIPILLFLAIQLIPVWLVQTDPPVVNEPKWNSPQTAALVHRACYDCHSNQTVWPWYSRVAPVSWFVTQDVLRGRNRLNFSEWGVARPQGGEGREGREGTSAFQMARTIERGDMPPWEYLPLHPDANLTPTEKQELIQGLEASLGGTNPTGNVP